MPSFTLTGFQTNFVFVPHVLARRPLAHSIWSLASLEPTELRVLAPDAEMYLVIIGLCVSFSLSLSLSIALLVVLALTYSPLFFSLSFSFNSHCLPRF